MHLLQLTLLEKAMNNKKKAALKNLFVSMFLFLPGCSSLTMQHPSILIEHEKPSINTSQFVDESINPGLNIMAHQVLDHPKKNKAQLSAMSAQYGIKYYDDDAPLVEEMRTSPVLKEILKGVVNKDNISLDRSDFDDFADAVDKQLKRTFLNGEAQNKINIARQNGEISFDDVLIRYAKAYIKGDLVLRDGTKLAKPSGNIDFKNGVVNASIDNNTVVGLTTVFLEAFYDFIFPTPVLADIGANIGYSQAPQYSGKTDEDNKKLYLMLYHQDLSNNYFTESNNAPTVEKEKLFPIEQLVKDDSKGISAKELKAIHFISGILSQGAKSASSAAFGSLGGVGISFLGFAKFSIGDNDAIGKIVETNFDVFTRRATEYNLYEFFKSHEIGKNAEVDKSLLIY